jgi:integrase
MKRRGRGEGLIRQRANGLWEACLDLGRGPDGKRKRKSVYAASEAEVVKKANVLRGRLAAGDLVTTTTPTVAAFLDNWLTTRSRPSAKKPLRLTSQRSYRTCIDTLLIPAFGSLRLDQLTSLRIQKWLNDQEAEHGARRHVAVAHAVLRSALTKARKMRLVTDNAAMLVDVPQPKRRPIHPLTIEEGKAFLEVAGQHRLGALFTVALACGLRLGEALGLPWDAVNLTTGEVEIRQQLQWVKLKGQRGIFVIVDVKTAKSRRTLVLPPNCLEALRTHRTRQREERLKAGAAWVDGGGLVFTTYGQLARPNRRPGRPFGGKRKVGGPLSPRNVTRVLHALLEAVPITPRRRFHELRHSAATLLIASGVQLADVSALLGHSELRVTADLYNHLVKQTAVRAAGIMGDLLRPGRPGQ